jgi:hypothetical protein
VTAVVVMVVVAAVVVLVAVAAVEFVEVRPQVLHITGQNSWNMIATIPSTHNSASEHNCASS